PLPSPEIQYLLHTLLAKSIGHPISPLWQAFFPVPTNKKPKASCIFCKLDKPISDTAAQQKIAMNLTIIQDQQLSILSEELITPSISTSNNLIVSTKANNNYFTHLLIDAYESNKLLLESIIEGGIPLLFVDLKKFKQFVYSINTNYHVLARRHLSNNILNNVYKKTNLRQDYIINFMAIGKNRRVELVRIKDTFGKSQTSIIIFKDLEDTLI
ncbi:31053_t:CDS:2, partial [Racocetra persica]